MTYNVGIIGTGFGAKVHLPALIYHPDFKPVIIAGRNKEKAEKIAAEYNIKSVRRAGGHKSLGINSLLPLIF